MITIIINIMFYLGLTLLFVESEPMIILKRKLGFKEEEIEVYGSLKRSFTKLIYCTYCSSVYIAFILHCLRTSDIESSFIMMSITSFFMYLINKQKF